MTTSRRECVGRWSAFLVNKPKRVFFIGIDTDARFPKHPIFIFNNDIIKCFSNLETDVREQKWKKNILLHFSSRHYISCLIIDKINPNVIEKTSMRIFIDHTFLLIDRLNNLSLILIQEDQFFEQNTQYLISIQRRTNEKGYQWYTLFRKMLYLSNFFVLSQFFHPKHMLEWNLAPSVYKFKKSLVSKTYERHPNLPRMYRLIGTLVEILNSKATQTCIPVLGKI